MNRAVIAITGILLASWSGLFGIEQQQANIQTVAKTDGLIAFWDFNYSKDNTWMSYYDPKTSDRSCPLHLKRIGDPKTYSPNTWPYKDAGSKLIFDAGGPFGRAVRFNRGYIYGVVERKDLDSTLLNLHGKRPFTIIAWVKFVGKRHMVAGIWDEGGWNKYAGRRQVALFGGLFGQRGVIAHVSTTGAASYPQSTTRGAQYARCRAIDGKPFKNNQWIAMAATYDPQRAEVVAYLNGAMTPLALTDPVARDVYRYKHKQAANPFRFPHPIYSPRAFTLKYNGYNVNDSGISEHRLYVDLDKRRLTYEQDKPRGTTSQAFRVVFDIRRRGASILPKPIEIRGVHGQTAVIGSEAKVMANDEVRTRLKCWQDGNWRQVGTAVRRKICQGAPFTFGRALGLGSEDLKHGSQLYLDGVAVFNRVLTKKELEKLSFNRSNRD